MDNNFFLPLGVVEISAIAGVLVVSFVSLFFFLRSKKKKKTVPAIEVSAGAPTPAVTPAAVPPATPKLSDRMSRTRELFRGRLGKFLGTGQSLQSQQWNELEEVLLEADIGVATSNLLLDRVKEQKGSSSQVRELLRHECRGLLEGLSHGPVDIAKAKPFVISIVGVNGVGKTTTIGKLANRFREQGLTVLLGAADTFRAGAIAQLKIWSERTGAQFVAGKEGGDPGAVAFDAMSAGKARNVDVVILDTAGRLHTKHNLMEELKKIHRVIKKVIPEAPHETWLVLDGTIGQNSIQQAKEFQKTLELTGVVITKLDGTAKGGAIFAIASELKLPIKYIGIGESAADFIPFEPSQFVDAILGNDGA